MIRINRPACAILFCPYLAVGRFLLYPGDGVWAFRPHPTPLCARCAYHLLPSTHDFWFTRLWTIPVPLWRGVGSFTTRLRRA